MFIRLWSTVLLLVFLISTWTDAQSVVNETIFGLSSTTQSTVVQSALTQPTSTTTATTHRSTTTPATTTTTRTTTRTTTASSSSLLTISSTQGMSTRPTPGPSTAKSTSTSVNVQTSGLAPTTIIVPFISSTPAAVATPLITSYYYSTATTTRSILTTLPTTTKSILTTLPTTTTSILTTLPTTTSATLLSTTKLSTTHTIQTSSTILPVIITTTTPKSTTPITTPTLTSSKSSAFPKTTTEPVQHIQVACSNSISDANSVSRKKRKQRDTNTQNYANGLVPGISKSLNVLNSSRIVDVTVVADPATNDLVFQFSILPDFDQPASDIVRVLVQEWETYHSLSPPFMDMYNTMLNPIAIYNWTDNGVCPTQQCASNEICECNPVGIFYCLCVTSSCNNVSSVATTSTSCINQVSCIVPAVVVPVFLGLLLILIAITSIIYCKKFLTKKNNRDVNVGIPNPLYSSVDIDPIVINYNDDHDTKTSYSSHDA